MSSTDEELLHGFYAGDNNALLRLAEQLDPMLLRISYSILQARTGSGLQAMTEWNPDERLTSEWVHVRSTRQVNIGRWPNQRLTVLTWLIHLLCQEMDRHLGFREPY